MTSRLGIDVGGTFTDLLLFDDEKGELALLKTPSTPADQSTGIVRGIQSLAARHHISLPRVHGVLHGTTVPTNIILEGKGAKVGLLVTEHFEQVLHLARSQTPGPLAGWMIMEKPEPLADLELTRGVPERMSARGEVIAPLEEVRARELTAELLAAGAESITISLLHAYANPSHEQRLKAIVGELAPGLPVSLSSEILPEFREYERTLVTVMNAYLRPSMDRYLTALRDKLKQFELTAHINIVRSDGGLMSLERAAESPVHTMLSGPAGGVSGAAQIAAVAGHPDALGFDMGGTSTDVSLIRNGQPSVSRQTALGQYPIKVPSVEVHSVGAGGGSIAHVPITGALRVGPASAGAMPGPACYGHGGEQATVTDANLVLGRLPPSLLGGEMALDLKAAEEAIGRLARRLDLDLHQAAAGVLAIVNENMFGALRLVTVQKGWDPREFALVAFGGAGPLHGNALAELAGCFPVIIPPTPGVLSALGFLYADVKNEFAQTFIRNLDDLEAGELGGVLSELGRQASAWLDAEGIPDGEQQLHFEVDVRYFRQGYEFPLEIDPRQLDNGGMPAIQERFGDAHHQAYGFRLDHPVEVVNARALGIGRINRVEFPRFDRGDSDPAAAVLDQQRVHFDGAFVTAEVYSRERLRAGHRLLGPALITQEDSTTIIHPGYVGTVDERLNLLIQPRESP